MQRAGVLILGSLMIALTSQALAANQNDVPRLAHVMTVIFENEDAEPTMAQPFFAKLAQEGVNFVDFHAETHPSQPNYLALTSGSMQGIDSDKTVDVDAKNIVDLLEAKGKTWKVYAEDYPGHCFTGTKKGRYVRKHNPFISYTNINTDAQRCAKIVDASELNADIAAGTLPDYAFYVPNMDNDAHDTDLAYANAWYAKTFGPLLQNPRFTKGLLLITTFDESSLTGGNVIYTSFYGEMVKPGVEYKDYADHYSILRTIEAGLGLADLGLDDASAEPFAGIWR
jgi:hypothetical protein